MGDGRLIESPKPNSVEPEAGGRSGSSAFSIAELFDRECGFYLHAGMTPEMFWDGDPCAVRWYRDKHKYDQEQRNAELWMQGAYIYQALLRLAPALKPFVKDPKPEPYMDKPFPLTREQAEIQKKSKEEQQQEVALANFRAKAKAINEKRGGDVDDGTGGS